MAHNYDIYTLNLHNTCQIGCIYAVLSLFIFPESPEYLGLLCKLSNMVQIFNVDSKFIPTRTKERIKN